jgi:hypothetical protein
MSKVSIQIEAAESQPLRTGSQHGRSYVGGEIGQRYNIVVENLTWRRIAVVVTVDGKNVLDGKPGDPDGQAMIIDGNSRYSFKGWRTSLTEVAAFRLTEAGQSYAAKTGDASNVGVIGMAAFEEKAREVYRSGGIRGQSAGGDWLGQPVARPAVMRARGSIGAQAVPASAGTGFGEKLDSRVGTTTFDRATETPVEVHVVYYDTTAGLIARGILPADGPNPFPARKPEPQFCTPPEQP